MLYVYEVVLYLLSGLLVLIYLCRGVAVFCKRRVL